MKKIRSTLIIESKHLTLPRLQNPMLLMTLDLPLNERKDIYGLLKSRTGDPAYKVCTFSNHIAFSICLI